MTGSRCRWRLSTPLLAACALWVGLAAEAAGQGSAASDRAVLEALYDATGGPDWIDNTNWRTAAPLGEWFGVTTDPAGRAARLELPGNALAGPIPASLGNLTQLRALSLRDNHDLTGPIPSALRSLVNLKWLDLRNNTFSGPIPVELGGLASLEELDLSYNVLTGPLPVELGSLLNLVSLNLARNPMAGPLPQWLTGLSQLRRLNVAFTELCAPAEVAFQEWLAAIDFTGVTCNRPPEPVDSIPSQALTGSGAAIAVRVEVYFSDPDGDPLTYAAASSHTGAVTAVASADTIWLVPVAPGTATVTVTATDPGGLSATQTIAVTVNASAGPQNDREVLEVLYDSTGGESWTNRKNWTTSEPLDLWYGVTTDDAGRVIDLDLSGNALTGPIPAALGDLELLQSLNLGERWDSMSRQWFTNALTGPIPHELDRLENLTQLSLGSNALTGQIPRELRNLVNLERLNLNGNDLSGPVPAGLGRLTSLRRLSVGGNELTGPIPAELGNLVNLERLNLNGNALSGSVPAALGRLSNLGYLDLAFNELTGRIPDAVGNLANLDTLYLDTNGLTGLIPPKLGNLVKLRVLSLSGNDLSGPIPAELGNLANLQRLRLGYNWGLSGPLPTHLQASRLGDLDIFVTQACAPVVWRGWLEKIEFRGAPCGAGAEVTIDVAVVYTPIARERAGGIAAIEADIDLMVAETNQVYYAASGVHQRLALVARVEVPYTESGDTAKDLFRLADPSDGQLDEVHDLRDAVGADLVHLVVGEGAGDGIALQNGAFSVSKTYGAARPGVFAHELGHSMGLLHDRYKVHHTEGGAGPHPAHGYVNRRAVEPSAKRPNRWMTVMSYGIECGYAYVNCWVLPRFSNARQRYNGDPLGVPHAGAGESGVDGPADAAAVLNATGPAVALWRDRPTGANRRPAVAKALRDRVLALPGTLEVDVSEAFADPDGDALTYTVSTSAPSVVTASAAGGRVTLTAAAAGTATVQVTATDPGELSATQSFLATVTAPGARFTDEGIRPGVTPVRAIHFMELRARIDLLRGAAGLGRQRWTDPVLQAGVTPVRLVHLTELRSALEAAYTAAGRPVPRWTDPAPVRGRTPVRAVHLTELRNAVVALE